MNMSYSNPCPVQTRLIPLYNSYLHPLGSALSETAVQTRFHQELYFSCVRESYKMKKKKFLCLVIVHVFPERFSTKKTCFRD